MPQWEAGRVSVCNASKDCNQPRRYDKIAWIDVRMEQNLSVSFTDVSVARRYQESSMHHDYAGGHDEKQYEHVPEQNLQHNSIVLRKQGRANLKIWMDWRPLKFRHSHYNRQKDKR